MEKKCFQDVVKCEKHYQLMYISQNLEVRFIDKLKIITIYIFDSYYFNIMY